MKNLKTTNSIVQALFLIVLTSILFSAPPFNVPVYITGSILIAGTGIATIAAIFGKGIKGLCAGIYREIWTGELQKYLTASDQNTWMNLAGTTDYSQYVANVGDEMAVIHLASMDVLPDVLINNTTYPIPLQNLAITDIPIALDKYQTKRTPITDDELVALSVKKMAAVIDRHGLAIVIQKNKKAIHSMAPADGTVAAMPVLLTTGADDGTGRLKLTWDDIVTFKRKIDALEYPEDDRTLVLCAEHVNDLINNDQRFQNMYYNRADGKPYNQLGFNFYDYVGNPYYTPSTKAKLSYGSVPAGTDQRASIYFNNSNVAKATGWTKMYYRIAATQPDTQQNEINFRTYFIMLPKRNIARGAIISANAS